MVDFKVIVILGIVSIILGYLSQIDLRLLDNVHHGTPSQTAVTAFYDRFGPYLMNDFYHHTFEAIAMERMLSLCEIAPGDRVLEIGPGTGFLASKILNTLNKNPEQSSQYVGIEVSSSMHHTCQKTLEGFFASDNLEIQLHLVDDSTIALSKMDLSVNKVVLTYVMDLLPEDDLHQLVSILHDKLESNTDNYLSSSPNKICVVNLTYGIDTFSRLLTNLWQLAYRLLGGEFVGGCRPLQIEQYFHQENGFVVDRVDKVVSNGLPSEIAIIHKI
jgi:phospholipid N-methyltransferase